jgi:hypothetical protein
MAGVRRTAMVAILGSLLAACAAPTPSPSPSSTPEPTPSPTLEATIPVNVQFKGRVNCNIGFAFYCSPSLSVVEPGTDLPDSWRPGEADPIWHTRGEQNQNVNGRRWTLLRGEPVVAPGPHRLVVSLLGQSDVASYNPDGTVASELMGRCTTDVDVAPDAASLDLVVTFESEPEDTAATCTITVAGD